MGDELRGMLDERHVRHMDAGDMTLWADRCGNRWCATEQPGGKLHLQSLDFITARRCVAATLGPGTGGDGR